MAEKEDKCGLAVEDFFVTWNRLRLESTATEDIKEAPSTHELERRILELEAKVAELERMARK